ncbi:M23 family metallopeptidase [Riemerella columbipharyngis]|uniref:Murein DD-endopeptidase MepM and murein hydrolase activator NlpD, contain LysM domain n=1 Tax=Riemerella columbipharyngis TaxID=1071918 RepID=A0A1G6ZEC4_9FLAO|nr:M23 family metallopeptidase [Riemerella columbipharyngis]SDE00126.1 Murein DD-endopeptidase MepM and murein hydrolase activator NlpD, contain LysM domain [Riemerella columbipharyngis]
MKIKIIFTIGLLCGFLQVNSQQFNTLFATKLKDREVKNVIDTNAVSNKKENFLLKLFSKKRNKEKKNTETKNKNEKNEIIDSLKTLFKEYNENILKKVFIEKYKEIENRKNKSSNNQEKDSSPRIHMPIGDELVVTSKYGMRFHPIERKWKLHNGVDLKANFQNVYAVLNGFVTKAGWDTKGGGNYIVINHPMGFQTEYLHLSKVYYKVGELVKSGYVIGKSGMSGEATGPHLHFAVKEYGKFINPVKFLKELIKANNLISKNNE